MSNFLGYGVVVLERKKPYFVMVMVQVILAGMALMSKSAVAKGMNPSVFVAYRQAVATLCLAPFAIFIERNKAGPLTYSVLWKIFLVSFFGITLSLNLYNMALKYTTATLAAASTNTIPAITFVLATLFRMERVSIKERHGMAKVLGCGLSVCGALVFGFVKGPQLKFMDWSSRGTHKSSSFDDKNQSFTSRQEVVKGALVMLSANTLWSLWLIMQGPLMRQYPGAALRLTTLQCMFSCVQAAIWGMANEPDISSWKLGWDANLVSVLYCGVIVGGISYWLQLWGVKKKGPVFTAMFTPLALVLTAIVSALLWNEILHLGSVCGGILLVVGLYCVLWGKKREAEAEEAKRQIPEAKQDGLVVVVVVECVP